MGLFGKSKTTKFTVAISIISALAAVSEAIANVKKYNEEQTK